MTDIAARQSFEDSGSGRRPAAGRSGRRPAAGRCGRRPASGRPAAGRFAAGRHTARRYLAGVSAVGIAAGLVLTGAATGSAAPASGDSAKGASVITLTSNTSSPVGQLTVRFRYRLGKGGAKPLSLTFSGGSALKIAHPALVFSLQPVPGPFPGKPGKRGQVKVRERVFAIVVRIHDVRHFSGKLPVKDLRLNWKFGKRSRVRIGPSAVLEASVASVTKRPFSISAPVGLQVGILLGPLALGAVPHPRVEISS